MGGRCSEGVKAMRRPPVDRRTIVEAMEWPGRQTLGRFSARQVLDRIRGRSREQNTDPERIGHLEP